MAAAQFTTLKELSSSEYVKKSLEIVALSQGFKNYKLNFDHGARVGDGFIGVIFKAQIKETDSEKVLDVLVKVPPQDEKGNAMPERMVSFDREVYFYNILLPGLIKFQEEKEIDKAQGFLSFPKVYYADYNLELFRAIIVMEDLRDGGYQMLDKSKPIDFEHSKLVIQSLGRLHALSFAMKKQKPEVFEKFMRAQDNIADLVKNESLDGILLLSISYATKILENLNPNDPGREKFMELVNDVGGVLAYCYGNEPAEPHAVFSHGDCWVNNLMFRGKNYNGAPTEIIFIDWQDSRYCSPAADLTFFLFICTDKALRDKHYDELIKIYYQSLTEFLNHLGCETQFSFSTLLEHLKQFGKSGIISGCCAVPLLYLKGDDMEDMAETLQNLDPNEMDKILDLFVEMNKDIIEDINGRIRDIIQDGICYGYL